MNSRQDYAPAEEVRATPAVSLSGAAGAPRSLGIFALAIAVTWAALGAFAFHTNQPENVLTAEWQVDVKATVQAVLPEQWGFFTRSPREDVLVPYRFHEQGGWTSAALYPHSQVQHIFGWNRISRAQGVEVGLIYTVIPETNWIACETGAGPVDCLESTGDSSNVWQPVENTSPSPTLCGQGSLARSRIAPWAYSNIGQSQTTYSIALVDVLC